MIIESLYGGISKKIENCCAVMKGNGETGGIDIEDKLDLTMRTR